MTEAPYVSAARAARAIGCTKQWICELARDGEIVGAFKLDGGPWCIPRGWVGDALLATLILADAAVSDRKPDAFTGSRERRIRGERDAA